MRQVPPLPRKVDHQEGEPAYALLIRALEHNGTRRLYTTVRRISGSKTTSVSQLDPVEVARICKVDPAALVHATPAVGTASATMMGETVSAAHVGVRTRRWCPACLAENAYYRVWWDLLPVTSCPSHGIRLVESCGCEDRPVRWRSNRTMHCAAGHSFSSAARVEAHPDVLALDAYVIGRLLGRGDGSLPLLDDLPLGELLTLCERLGKASIDEDAPFHEVRRRNDTGRVHAEGFRILGDIPANVGRLLEGIRAGNDRRGGRNNMRKSYGGLYHYILRLPDHPVGDALRHTLYEHAGRHFPVKVGKRSGVGFRSDPGIPLVAAADAVGVGYPRFRDLLDRLAIPHRARERGQGNGLRGEMSLAAFEELRRRLEGFQTLACVSGELGLPVTDTVELANAGRLDLIAPGQGLANWFFGAGAAGKLLAALRAVAVRAVAVRAEGGSGRYVSLRLAARDCGVSMAGVLSLVLDGVVPARLDGVRHARRRDYGVLALDVDARTLADHVALTGVTDPTPASAARSLGLSQSTMEAVIEAGLILTDVTPDGVRVPAAEIDRFRTSFVTASELRREMGVRSFMPVAAAMAAAGVEPAAKGSRPMEMVYHRHPAMAASAEAGRRYASPPEPGESRVSVARQLRVSPSMLRQLIETGLIAMQDGCRYGSIAAAEVARFKAAYVLTSELAGVSDVRSPRAIVAVLASSGVRPVSGPPTLHYHLYDRREAERAMLAFAAKGTVDAPPVRRQGPTLDTAELCERLGTNPRMALQLVRAGLLVSEGPIERGRPVAVPLPEVERFVRANVFANELGRLAGRVQSKGTGKTITLNLLRNGLRPVCSTPEFATFVFDRGEAIALMRRLGLVQVPE